MKTCAEGGNLKDFQEIQYPEDFSISNAEDPFNDPRNRVEQWINRDKDGRPVQINQRIVLGPDTGIHRFYDIRNRRSGETGVTRFIEGGKIEERKL